MSATQRHKFHTNDVNQCLHNKSGSHGFQMQICSILQFSWSILVKCCADVCWAPAKLKCFFWRRLHSKNIDCFVRDSSCLLLTFVAFCLLTVIQCNYSVVQSALMTGFRTDFTSPVLYGISVSELQMFLHAKCPQLQRDGRNSCSFHRPLLLCLENLNISWGKATRNNENFGKQNVELASQGTSHKVTILIHSPLGN